jgi:hypothetical protein
MGDAAKRRATYEDVVAAPEHVVAEVVHGVLHTQPRPATPHTRAATRLGVELGGPFDRGRGGPGGWVILDEPELHLWRGHRRSGYRGLAAIAHASVRAEPFDALELELATLWAD